MIYHVKIEMRRDDEAFPRSLTTFALEADDWDDAHEKLHRHVVDPEGWGDMTIEQIDALLVAATAVRNGC